MAIQFVQAYPKVEEEKILKQHWKVLYNCDQEVAPDYPLIEEQFIKNMWVSVNKPNFIDEVASMSRKVFDQMDFDHNGHITQAEYLRLNGRRAGEECVPAAFNAMDINENRMVEFNEIIWSKHFYYSNESHLFNLMNGPLED